MATQKLFPADLYGQGTLNSIELPIPSSETTVVLEPATI